MMVLHMLIVISTTMMLFQALTAIWETRTPFQSKPVPTELMLYMSGVAKQYDETTWRQADV